MWDPKVPNYQWAKDAGEPSRLVQWIILHEIVFAHEGSIL